MTDATQQEGLVPVAITQAMVGRMVLTTRATSATLKDLPATAVRRDAVAVSGASGIPCPCCGQQTSAPTLAMVVDKYRLSPLQARILSAVWAGKGHPVSTEAVYLSMYVDDPDGGPSPNQAYRAFKVALFYVRARLHGSGIGIKTVGYRRGYQLVIGAPPEIRKQGPRPTSRSNMLTEAELADLADRQQQKWNAEIELADAQRLKRLADRVTANAESLATVQRRLQKSENGRRRLLERLAEEKHLRLLAEGKVSNEPRPDEEARNGCAKKALPTIRGELHPAAKLSNEQARAIRAEYEACKPKQRDLAEKYGVSQGTIGKIVNGLSFQDA